MSTTICIGIGANLGNTYARVLRAIHALSAFMSNVRCSSVYETLAFPDPTEPPFLNAVLIGETGLGPEEVLVQLKQIEEKLGRQVRTRWASREIDLDLLFYDQVRRENPHLTLPHASMHVRDFVLAPLTELWPDWQHPTMRVTAQALLEHLPSDATRTVIRRMEGLFPFDPVRVVAEIEEMGAVSVPLIPESLRQALLKEVSGCELVQAERYGGPYRVVQNLASSERFPVGGELLRFRDMLTVHLEAGFGRLPAYPFASPLRLNQLVVQYYEPTDVGVGSHRDFSIDRNLICIAMLGGDGQFCLYDDRAGNNKKPLDSTPGNVILMRAPGFRGSDIRPWHGAVDVTTPRTIFTLRQVRDHS